MTETEVNWDSVEEEAEFTAPVMPRQTSRAKSSTGGRGGRRISDKRLSALHDKLTAEMFQAGAMIGLGMPVTGYYIAQESDNFCDAIVTLASKNSQWVAALENIALLGPGITVGRTVLGIGAAMAADRYHRSNGDSGLDPERRSAMFLGVTAAYYAVHPPEGMRDSAESNGFGPPPHGAFNPVS